MPSSASLSIRIPVLLRQNRCHSHSHRGPNTRLRHDATTSPLSAGDVTAVGQVLAQVGRLLVAAEHAYRQLVGRVSPLAAHLLGVP